MSNVITLGGRLVGAGHPCFVIAEVGMNHNGDFALAQAMIAAAAEAGADAVKFQVFNAEDFVTKDALVYGEDKGALPSRQIDMLKPYEFTRDQWAALQDYAKARGIVFFATPLDEASLAMLETIDPPLYKIASCDVTYTALIRKVAGTGRPTILSTGMSTLDEVAGAVRAFHEAGGTQLALMQCTSAYPASMEDANLRCIPQLAATFGVPAGFSDHCKENYGVFAAVALGASLVEKHFTTSNDLPGVDQKMSLDPVAMADLVCGIRAVEVAMGTGTKLVVPAEQAARTNGRRGLVAACDIAPGTMIEPGMLVAKRPPTGIAPNLVDLVVGRLTRRPLAKDAPVTWDDF
jgi:Sialic acid synthase